MERDPRYPALSGGLPRWARRISRRRVLGGIAALGTAAGAGSLLAACGGTGATASPSASPTAAPATPAGSAPPATPTATPEPTPVPSPEGQVNVYNYDGYIGEDTVPKFQDKYGINVQYDFFDTYDTMFTKISSPPSGYDITFATSTDIPGLVARNLIQPLDLSLIPNVVNLAPEWKDPTYDPGNAHSVPYMWWTTGFAYDTKRIKEDLTSWSALWDERWKGHIGMLDDYREAFAVALIRLGYSVNTTDETQLDAALAMLQQQKPLLRDYAGDEIPGLISGDFWISHAWSGDVYQVQSERESVTYVLPEEGAVRGSDTMVILADAPHPIAAHLFINYMLDAEVSAANTNYIGYMGPNEAAKAFISPDILNDPTVNPDKALLDKLQELDDLGADLQKYHDRWNRLLAGA
jgi:spermidine/putrescine transport system substrate-binding protein